LVSSSALTTVVGVAKRDVVATESIAEPEDNVMATIRLELVHQQLLDGELILAIVRCREELRQQRSYHITHACRDAPVTDEHTNVFGIKGVLAQIKHFRVLHSLQIVEGEILLAH